MPLAIIRPRGCAALRQPRPRWRIVQAAPASSPGFPAVGHGRESNRQKVARRTRRAGIALVFSYFKPVGLGVARLPTFADFFQLPCRAKFFQHPASRVPSPPPETSEASRTPIKNSGLPDSAQCWRMANKIFSCGNPSRGKSAWRVHRSHLSAAALNHAFREHPLMLATNSARYSSGEHRSVTPCLWCSWSHDSKAASIIRGVTGSLILCACNAQALPNSSKLRCVLAAPSWHGDVLA